MSVELKSQQETIVDLSTHVTFITNWLEKSVTPEQCTAAFNDFAAAVKRPAITASDRTAHESIVAAVYVDHQRRTDRATNFIVTGLPPSDIRPDPQAVVDLCRRELGEAPDIVHTKRLGKLMPGRVQPLLVVLRTAAQAVRLVTAGKKLRKSLDLFTKENIFIAANLTKAEARAAYELRCQRRQAAERRKQPEQQRQQQQQQPQQPPATTSASHNVVNRFVPAAATPALSQPQPRPQQQQQLLKSSMHPSSQQPDAPSAAQQQQSSWQPSMQYPATGSSQPLPLLLHELSNVTQHQQPTPVQCSQWLVGQPPVLHRLTAEQSSPPPFMQLQWQQPQQHPGPVLFDASVGGSQPVHPLQSSSHNYQQQQQQQLTSQLFSGDGGAVPPSQQPLYGPVSSDYLSAPSYLSLPFPAPPPPVAGPSGSLGGPR